MLWHYYLLKKIKFVEIGTENYAQSNTRYIFETMRCDGLIIDPLENLQNEGIPKEKCFFVGNTMIDSLVEFNDKFDDSNIIDELDLTKQNYALITIHRPFTVDNEDRLFEMMDSLVDVSKEIQCVFPIHPRTKNILIEFGRFPEYQEG